VNTTADVKVYGGSFKNKDAMPKMSGGGSSPTIIFPDNVVIYVDENGRYNVVPESSVSSLSYEAVSAAYNDTRFSTYMHEVDGQNRYKNFYWADADLAIPNIDKVFYRTIKMSRLLLIRLLALEMRIRLALLMSRPKAHRILVQSRFRVRRPDL